MKSIKEIVARNTEEIQDEFFGKNELQERINSSINSYGDLDYGKLVSEIIAISTEYSNTVLLEVLRTLEDEGYFKD